MRREILRNLDERKGEYIYICIYNVLEGDYARRGPRGIVLAGEDARPARNSKTCRAISLQACRRDGE